MWIWITGLLLLGYLGLSRTFAYLGIPPWKVFVGEVTLALFLIWGPRAGRSSWLKFTLKLPYLHDFWICYGFFFASWVFPALLCFPKVKPPLMPRLRLPFRL